MLHDHVKIIVSDQVLNYPNCALLSLAKILQRHRALNLHHDTLLEVRTALSEVFELFDEQQGLGEFVLRHIGLNRW